MIYLTADPATYPAGLDLGRQPGWSSTSTYTSTDDQGNPVRQSDRVRFVAAGGGLTLQDAQGTDQGHVASAFSTCLYNVGVPDFRVRARLSYGQHVYLGSDCDNCFAVTWIASDTNSVLAITDPPKLGGADLPNDPATATPNSWATYFIKFPPASHVSSTATIDIVKAGDRLHFLVNGRAVEDWIASGVGVSDSNYHTDQGPTWLIPQGLRGVTRAGFGSVYGSGVEPAWLQLRDNHDLVLLSGIGERRNSDDNQRVKAKGSCTVAGATQVGLKLVGPGGVVAQTTVPVAAGAWSVDAKGVLPVPPALEGSVITLELTAAGSGISDTLDVPFYAQVTPPYTPPSIGINCDDFAYYKTAPFRDLARTIEWRHPDTGAYLRPDFATYGAPGSVRWSDVGNGKVFSDRGMPIAWTASGLHVATLLWTLESNWVGRPTILTLPPGLDFGFSGNIPANVATIHVEKNLATGVHIVTFGQKDIWSTQLQLFQRAGVPNGGLPTEDWSISWRLAGDTSTHLLNDEFTRWFAQTGTGHIRFMKGSLAEEDAPPGTPPDPARFSAGHETMVTDHCWIQNGMRLRPWETEIELCNRTEKDYWIVFPRGCDASYIQRAAELIRDHLDPGRKVFMEVSNEVWNFGYSVAVSYAFDGLRRGLGKKDAVYGRDNGSYFPGNVMPPEWSQQASYRKGTEISYHASTYIAQADFTPTQEDLDWDPGQHYGADAPSSPPFATDLWHVNHDYPLARFRAHKEDIKRTGDIFRAALGDQAGRLAVMGTYLENALDPVQGGVTTGGQPIVDIYLTWGTTPAADGTVVTDIDRMAIGAYMYQRGDYSLPANTPPELAAAAPGADRRAVMLALLMADAALMVDQHSASAVALAQRCADLKIANKPAIAIYEAGNGLLDITNWPNQATDQAFYDDVQYWTREAMAAAYLEMYNGLAEEVGGLITTFTSLEAPMAHTWPGPQDHYAQYWAQGDMPSDTTGALFKALQAVALAWGGHLVDVPIFGMLLGRRRYRVNRLRAA